MTWKIEIVPSVIKELSKLDQQVAKRILKFLHKRIASLKDPRSIGSALKGSRFGEFWRYRVGDYRIITKIEDNILLIIVLRVGHRKQIYN
ncbi:MAG: type II toxin-antitoxin system RelE family toxin [Smithella sp.]